MHIKKLAFKDTFRKVNISPIEFQDITLLVGVSGVGKTQIIKSILALQDVAEGSAVNGIKWDIEFESSHGGYYKWEGEFEIIKGLYEHISKSENDEPVKKKPKILYEKLFLNGEQIIQRDENNIIFNGLKTVKLSGYESVVSLLKEEELLLPVFRGFKKIIFSSNAKSMEESLYMPGIQYIKELENHYTDLESIKQLDEHFKVKLYLISIYFPDLFDYIKDRFIEIFPQVEDLKVAVFETDKQYYNIYEDELMIQFKEKNVEDWIIERNISSGMYRVLKHLAEIYLSSKGTVILIDEFENSLGVNCIDELTQDLFGNNDRNIQFIITSHHPYIINNIGYEYWKIVTRQANDIVTYNAKDLNIGMSKHNAFIQLINNEEFYKGVSSK